MCGIIGLISRNTVAAHLLEGLKRLEYRGYDSSGIATISGNLIHLAKASGKIVNLEKELAVSHPQGNIGIGHTRWATHGEANQNNAHPHITDKVALVHNGIIENHAKLRLELENKGYKFHSDTDTEVIPIYITYFLEQGKEPLQAVQMTLAKLEGAFAIAVLFKDYSNMLIGARKGSPLAVGYDEQQMIIGSDAYAIAPFAKRISYLEEGDVAVISLAGAEIYSRNGELVNRNIKNLSQGQIMAGKGEYRHFMLKEIFEQPLVIGETINHYRNNSKLEEFADFVSKSKHINIIACGTSYYAGMVAKYWLEELANIKVNVEIASEYRYRNPAIDDGDIALFISQSGETADTLAALKYLKERKVKTAAITNVEESSIDREVDFSFLTLAGVEIGVASTKAHTTQLALLFIIALNVARIKGTIAKEEFDRHFSSLISIPAKIIEVLENSASYEKIARNISAYNNILYIGRGVSYPVALEAALKMKELSYIHAEAIAAGELKHGTIALIDENMPVIAIIPTDRLFDKTLSNIQEIAARGGKIIAISDCKEINANEVVFVPKENGLASPLLYLVPVQLLAYYTACHKGTDVDQPRNLAKSVTVE